MSRFGRTPFTITLALTALVAYAETLTAREPEGILRTPGDIVYAGNTEGAETAILYGDPTKLGLYVMRVKFPPGLKILPHFHPEEVRTAAVISGTLWFAFGETWDETKLKPFPPGSFIAEPAKTPHYAWAKDGEVVVHLTAMGPTGTTMVGEGETAE